MIVPSGSFSAGSFVSPVAALVERRASASDAIVHFDAPDLNAPGREPALDELGLKPSLVDAVRWGRNRAV
jgi:hypothetical protein